MEEDITFSKSASKIQVQWTIKKFFDQCRQNNYFLNTPCFALNSTQWHLMVRLRHQSMNPLSGLIDLYLKNEVCLEGRFACEIGIKQNNSILKRCDFTFVSGSSVNTWGVTGMIQTKEGYSPYSSNYNSNEPVKDGFLTVFCNICLEDAMSKTTAISSLDGMPTLSDNIKDLYINKRYTDVTIKVKTKEFLAHKLVLTARSPVFAAMFEHDTAEKNTGIVEIADCDPYSFDQFLLFLYTGKFDNISSSNTLNLYKTADKYDIKELKEECVRCMTRELSIDSFCDIFHFAKMHEESDLLTAAIKFFAINVHNILPTVKWQTLLLENPSVGNELFLEFATKEKSN